MMIYGRKPIMSPELEAQVLNAVVQYSKSVKWKQWGLYKIRKQGAAILLKGPPGTGKTVIAEFLALKVRRKGIKEVTFADFGSATPGENSRQIRKIFQAAKDNGLMTIFLDECDAILWDRSKAGGDSMWMLEVIDELLIQIAKYSGLVILASNKDELLDAALYRRLLAIIHVGYPEKPERIKLWQSKLPEEFPLKLSLDQFSDIATLQLSGAEIENAIIDYASECLRTEKKPHYDGLKITANETWERRVRYGKTQQESQNH